MSNIAIIGGGAAGMMAAIGAAICGHEVHIYEKNEKLGKKIYITGKGRCNVTNASDMDTLFKNIVTNPKFMYSAFYTLSNDAVISMFNDDMSVPTKVERGNRVFPSSDKSSDIIFGLTRRLKELGVHIHLGYNVADVAIKQLDDGTKRVSGIKLSDGEIIEADNIIVATGGFSYQTTGSDGAGYEFAKKTGHTVTDILPALVPLNTKEDYARRLQGLSLKNIKATFYNKNKEIYSEFGEMLFTHFGVSGPVILSGSSYITKLLNKGESISLKIDLKPALSCDELDDRILRDFSENLNKDFGNSLGKLLPAKLIPIIIELSEINPHKKVNEITREERGRLVELLKGLPLNVASTRSFNEAIITQGGVSVKDINPATMESKHINNLYFAGEIIDIDALTGGYNLQLAWSTGYLAGISVK
ncbi:MAG: NAD(P)/FAD-dependent oxidoreductase [Lachnospiraceae bacterium]|nr:NAD(P)/FAD-dependent oxidoreductase [Lachnospiraceae bacterium]